MTLGPQPHTAERWPEGWGNAPVSAGALATL